VIFGTVFDTKLKKNEIKVTVIASGFPDTTPRKTLFSGATNNAINTNAGMPAADDSEDRNKGRIFNSIFTNQAPAQSTTSASQPFPSAASRVEKPIEKVEEKKPRIEDDEDDDWGAIPAFLRRSKVK
jgi:cell division GTPase FtsZ